VSAKSATAVPSRRGTTRYSNGSTPSPARVSTSPSTRMVASSAAMAEPLRAMTMVAAATGPSSRTTTTTSTDPRTPPPAAEV